MIYLNQVLGIVWSAVAGAALAIVLVPAAMGQATTNAEGKAEAIDEVVTVGNKSLQRLQRDAINAEANFFDVFNSYNDDPRYEVKCEYKSSLGSRRKEHDCKAGFQRDYEEDIARGDNSLLGGGQEYARPSSKGMRRQQEEFRKKLGDAVSRHSEMREAMNEYAAAKKALEVERSKR